MKLHIVTLATGVYNVYLDELIDSIFKVLPEKLKGFELDVNVIADTDYVSPNEEYNKHITNYHIVNMPYPLIALHKFIYIYDMYIRNNYDPTEKFLFIDADSVFISEANYDKIINDIMEYDLIFSISPWSCGPLNEGYWNDITNRENPKPTSVGYRPNPVRENFIQTSFLVGNALSLKKLNNLVYKYASIDLNSELTNRYLPEYVEQAYTNKILDEQLNNGNVIIHDCKIKADKYIYNDYGETYAYDHDRYIDLIINGYSDRTFVNQKIKQHLKDSKRNSTEYDSEV
jgi:hypothetical protein